jgi:group I intron endonuclease
MALFQEFAGISGIYRILNARNGKFYIGSTNNAQKRFKNHLNMLKNNNHYNDYIQNSYNKEQNKSVFKFQMLVYSEENVLISLEQRFIDEMKPHYNILRIAGRPPNLSGEKNSMFGRTGEKSPRFGTKKDKSPIWGKTGEQAPNNSLTEQQAIYALSSPNSHSSVADELGVKSEAIRRLRKGQTWRHLPRPSKELEKLWFSAGKITMGGAGEKARASKLTNVQALEIIASNKIASELAKQYGVGKETIRCIKIGKSWKHLPRNSPSA